ncbi:MAG: polysaccharide biosynthesis protein [Flavobacterium sp.]|nr:polysaccharide biosynthesis protein [Flavobacterium sp.]
MFDYLITLLKSSGLLKKLRTVGYLPIWIVFIIDLFIVVLSGVITHILLLNLLVHFHSGTVLVLGNLAIIAVNGLFFIFFRTFSGIIRHSTFIDGVKLLLSTSAAFMFLFVMNYFWEFNFGYKAYLNSALFINYILAFSLLFLFRIMVKYLFEVYSSIEDQKKRINAVIFGVDANAISVANALKTEMPARFNLLGFIDNNTTNNSRKSLLNLPIINHSRKTYTILRSLKADALIIAEKSLSKTDIIALVDECLEYNFKVYTVPLITDWEDQTQISNKVKSFDIEDLLGRKPIVLNTDNISSTLQNKTVLVTGAAGSIGSEIVRQVLQFNPKKIILLDQAETPLHQLVLELEELHTEVIRPFIADIRNKEVLETLFTKYKPEVVFHAAAYKHVPLMELNPLQAICTNVIGTQHLADLSIQYKVERFVMISTDKAVNPSNVMGASKRIAEKYIQSLHYLTNQTEGSITKFMTTRFGNVLGSNGSIVPLFSKQIKEGGPLTITHPEIIRYFMTIPEACQLVLEAAAIGNGGEIFIFDMGEPVKIIDLAKKMIRLAGFIPEQDIKIKVIGLRPGEKLFEELLNDTSKTLPTHNEKIVIAEEIIENHAEIQTEISHLIALISTGTSTELVMQMKKVVPEYISMNSVFESLDN